jgi:PST family polysaccharide transporter
MGSLQGVNYLIPIILIPLLLDRVGIDKYGIISLAQALVNLLVVIINFGLNLTGTKSFSQNLPPERQQRLFGNILISRLILWLIVGGGFLLLTTVIPSWRDIQLVLLLSLSIPLGQALMPVWYFQGNQKMGTMAILIISSRILYLVGVIIFIHRPEDFIWVNLINGSLSILAAAIGIGFAMRRSHFQLRFSIKESQTMLRNNVTIFFSVSSGTLYRNLPMIIAGFTLPEITLGVYSILDKLIQLMVNSFGVIFRAIYPTICQLMSEGLGRIRSMMIKTFLPLFLLTLAGSIILFLWGSEILIRVNEQIEHPQMNTLLEWMSLIPLLVIINVVISLLLLALNLNRQYLQYHLLAILSVVLIAPMSLILGVKALLFAYLIAESVMIVYGSWILRRTRLTSAPEML